MTPTLNRRRLQFHEFLTPVLLATLAGIVSLVSYEVVALGHQLVDSVNALRIEMGEVRVTLRQGAEHDAQTDKDIAELRAQDQWLLTYVVKKGRKP